MGPIDDTGKAIGSILSTMRDQPLAIAMMLTNVALLVYLFVNDANLATLRKSFIELTTKERQTTQELLAKCVDAEVLKNLLPPR